MKKRASRDPISRAFRQDFPELAARAKALGVSISLSPGRRDGRARVYWLDGYRQLTGFITRSDGQAFTMADAEKNIAEALAAIEEDRAKIEGMTAAERFARVMSHMRQMIPQSRMIGEVRLPCGDGAHCFFNAGFAGGARLHGIGEVARADAEWRRDESHAAQMSRFCDELEADFNARAAREAAND